MARRRRRKRAQPSPALNAVAVAAVVYAGWLHYLGDVHLAALATAPCLLVYAWGTWKINRVQDRWRAWRRRRREQIEAAPAIAAAVGIAGGAVWWVLASYIEVLVVVVGIAAVVYVVVRRRRRHPRVAVAPTRRWRDAKPVYFGWQADQNDTDQPFAWKIGVSVDPDGTWAGAFDRANPNPVHLVGHVPGGFPREKMLHRQVAGSKIPRSTGNTSREWFYDTQEVRAVIDQLCAEAGVPNPHPAGAPR